MAPSSTLPSTSGAVHSSMAPASFALRCPAAWMSFSAASWSATAVLTASVAAFTASAALARTDFAPAAAASLTACVASASRTAASPLTLSPSAVATSLPNLETSSWRLASVSLSTWPIIPTTLAWNLWRSPTGVARDASSMSLSIRWTTLGTPAGWEMPPSTVAQRRCTGPSLCRLPAAPTAPAGRLNTMARGASSQVGGQRVPGV
mmetsp:Transcript_21464/g.64080  ORF Transcript_21464/g.64080 Transcript_21464/m.64080 type:complete len:206 (+) Transcript_21464:569-1186(+)